MLGLNGHQAPETIDGCAPDLASCLDDARGESGPVQHRLTLSSRDGAKNDCKVTVRFDPIVASTTSDPAHWLVRLTDGPPGATTEEYRAWGLMARRVAHDLKNPLTSILLTIQRMQMEYREQVPETAETLDTYTERIEDRIEALREMTTNLMKFVGAEEPSFTQSDLNAFVEQRRAPIEERVPADIAVNVRSTAEALPIRIDEEQMASVLENLVANAVEAMHEGGTITLVTRLERGLQWSPEEGPRDWAVLEVRDTGSGMEPGIQTQIFEPGFTTGEDGTGLGLAIADKIVTDHDGHIELESEPDIGTVFSVYLPITKP
jgi:two-component system nitrogen regulation sensor histidine kinase NtrY